MPNTTPVEAELYEHDKAKRIEDEKAVIEMAEHLTNGDAGNPKMTGKVLLWQVHETISQGRLLRIIAAELKTYQKKTDCVASHEPKTWPVKIFGKTYSLPVTAAVIALYFLIHAMLKKNGWI